MATIVLVHGIAQEQSGADNLESLWLPALAAGVRVAGHPHTADLIWRGAAAGVIETRMAYYGDLFLMPGTQGGDSGVELRTNAQRDLSEQLAREWLERAAERDNPDQRAATAELSYLQGADRGEQGRRREAQRTALNGLARLRWFAPFGMAFAGKFVNRTLQQVTRYLTEDEIRKEVQRRVAVLIDADTKVLIGHSLGSVVAYEVAHDLKRPLPLLITLGSPLGLRTIVYDQVVPQPPTYPKLVQRWVNIADRNDLVAAQPDLRPMFGPLPPGAVFDGGWTVHNGAKPHEAEFYLTKEQTGRPVGEALGLSR